MMLNSTRDFLLIAMAVVFLQASPALSQGTFVPIIQPVDHVELYLSAFSGVDLGGLGMPTNGDLPEETLAFIESESSLSLLPGGAISLVNGAGLLRPIGNNRYVLSGWNGSPEQFENYRGAISIDYGPGGVEVSERLLSLFTVFETPAPAIAAPGRTVPAPEPTGVMLTTLGGILLTSRRRK